MRKGKKAKFSPCEREFVCQHETARDCETVTQLVHHILHGGHGEGKLPKFHHNYKFLFSMGSKNFFLSYAVVKMLILNLYSHFLRTITLANIDQILKVRIVLKSELSLPSENVQNFNPRCLRS